MLFSEKLKFIAVTALSVTICACSSTKVEQNDEGAFGGKTYTPIHKQTVIEETKTIVSDAENARYEEELEEGTVIIAAVPSKTVEKDLLDDIKDGVSSQVNVVTTDDSYNNVESEETAVEPSVSYQIGTVHFADGSAVVDTKYNAKFKEIAKLAKEKNAQVNVYGFSSSRTKNTDIVTHKMINFDASLKRAENVVKALIKAGVPKGAVSMEALSDSQPLYQEVMPEGERLNRRAEIYISY